MSTLAEVLARETREGELYDTLPDGRLRCYACGHCCPLPEGAIGVCKVRFNQGGRLLRAVGLRRRRAVRSDREEAVLPRLSRRARLQLRHARLRSALRLLPELGDVAGAARSGGGRAAACARRPSDWCATRCASGARVMVSTYNEPLITSEWAVAVFKEAQGGGPRRPGSSRTATARRRCSTTCGRGSISTRSISRASTIATTASSAAGSQPILDTIRRLHAMGVLGRDRHAARFPASTTRDDELTRLTAFVAERLARHPVARHRVPRRLQDDRSRRTRRAAMLLRAAEIGRASGLRYVYAGNLPGRGRRPRGHALRGLRRDADRALRLPHPRLHARRRTAAVRRARTRCQAAGAPAFDGQIASRPFLPGTTRCLRSLTSCDHESPSALIDASRARCATCGCRSPTAATCAASTACRRTDYVWLPREDMLQFEEISALVDVFTGARRRQGAAHRRRAAAPPRPRRRSCACSPRKPALARPRADDQRRAARRPGDALHAAGLRRITVSLDTLRRDRFKALTRFDELDARAAQASRRRAASSAR